MTIICFSCIKLKLRFKWKGLSDIGKCNTLLLLLNGFTFYLDNWKSRVRFSRHGQKSFRLPIVYQIDNVDATDIVLH